MTENSGSSSGREVTPAPDDPARSIMVRPVIEVDGQSPLRHVAEQMSDAGVGAVLVVRAGAAAGILSERDVVRALADGADPDEVWAADVMTTPILWVAPDDSISSVAELMELGGVRHAPVREGGRAIGMISVRDVLDVLV
jgi:CBS domain-containing protein